MALQCRLVQLRHLFGNHLRGSQGLQISKTAPEAVLIARLRGNGFGDIDSIRRAGTIVFSPPPRSLIEEAGDLMLRSGFSQLRRFDPAALHHITTAGVEGAA